MSGSVVGNVKPTHKKCNGENFILQPITLSPWISFLS